MTAAARRYARALLDVIGAQGEDPARVRGELEALAGAVAGHPELRAVLAHRALPAERKRAVLGALVEGRDVSPLVSRLVDLLAKRGRLELLPAVAQAFVAAWNAERGVVPAAAVSAVPLDADQRAALARELGRVTGRQVELTTRVDSALLGGVEVRLEGRVYDGSVRSRLRALRQHLTEEAPPGA